MQSLREIPIFLSSPDPDDLEVRRVSPAVRWARTATSGLLLMGFALLVAVLAGRLAHWSAAPVLTGSMEPTFGAGALVLTRPVPVAQVKPGDIAVFVPPHQSASYAHRVVSVTGSPEGPVLRTKGDANPAPDAWQARLSAPTVQVVAGHLPYAGRLVVHLHAPATRALLVGLLGLALTAVSVRLVLVTPTAAPVAS